MFLLYSSTDDFTKSKIDQALFEHIALSSDCIGPLGVGDYFQV